MSMYLYYLGVAFKVWMVIDAIQRRSEYFWFFVIVFVPFGEFIYFFVIKLGDYRSVQHSLAKQLAVKTGASVKDLRYQLSQSDSTANKLALATALYDRKDFDEAKSLYREVLERNHDEKPALHGLGLCLLGLGEYDQAVEVFKTVVGLDASYVGYGSWRSCAEAMWSAGRKEEALTCMRELVERDSRLEHKMILGEYLKDLGQSEEAKQLLISVVEDYKHSPRYLQRSNRQVFRKAKKLLGALT